MSQRNRVETMAVKLAAYAQRAGVPASQLLHAYGLAIELRSDVLRDVFHRELLHPARTVLILLEDAGVRAERVLAAGAVTETEFPQLRPNPNSVARALGPEVARLAAAVPLPEDTGDALLEELVSAQDDVALIAVAERLDHARHLHFRDRAIWPGFYRQITEIYLPFARRVNGALAVRLERWAGAFAKRLAD